MYELVSALAVTENSDGGYVPVDLTDITIRSIFADYLETYVTLFNSLLGKQVGLDLKNLPAGLKSSTKTLPQWLTENGNATITGLDETPKEFKMAYVKAFNARQLDFQVDFINRAYHPNARLTEEQLIDMALSHPDYDVAELQRNCLFTVSGLVHRTDTYYDRVLIYGGGRTAFKTSVDSIGIMDFSAVGGFNTIEVNASMAYKQLDTVSYKEAMYLELPEALGKRKPFLVLGGFLHIEDGICEVVGDNLLKIDFSKWPRFKRFDILREFFTLEELSVEMTNDWALKMSELEDEFFLNLIDMDQTFVGLIDVSDSDVYVRRHVLSNTGLPGVYETALDVAYPVIYGRGLVAETVDEMQHGRKVIRGVNYMAPRRDYVNSPYTDPSRNYVALMDDSNRPAEFDMASYLLINKNLEITDDN